MQTLSVDLGDRAYPIHIGPGLLDHAELVLPHLKQKRAVIVTNTTVGPLYLEQFTRTLSGAGVQVESVVLPDGEAYKNWETLNLIFDALLTQRAERKTTLIALGGGVVGDVAGFAAACYMRGIPFVQVPTTLLAQVDSSVGGKTGVNHPRGKNLIGAFHQPQAVVADTDTLRTLPPRELSAGLAEVLKHGLLADAGYFAQVTRDLPRLLACEERLLADAIARSCEIKAAIVARDERESGERALLNLGHTFGHAIEALTGYERWLHGEAVGCGMCLAADLSQRLGLIARGDVGAVEKAVAAAGLPTRIAGLSLTEALESMRGDKKADAGEIRFILLDRIGRAIQRSVPPDALHATLAAGGYR